MCEKGVTNMHFTLPALCITATLLLAFAGFVDKQRVWRVLGMGWRELV
jgi:hypothetical protein